MSAERNKPKSQLVGSGTNFPKEFAIRIFAGLALNLAENNIVKHLNPEFPEGFDEKFKKNMRDENAVPFIVSSHQGHVDGLAVAVVGKKLIDIAGNDRLQGFILPIAASIRAGYQGLFLKHAIIEADKVLSRHYSLFLVDYVRQKDIDKYRMQPYGFTFMRNLINKINQRYGIADFPETSVEGGTQNGKGIRGIQPIEHNNLFTLIEAVVKQKKEPLFIPVIVNGSYKIVNHNVDNKTGERKNKTGFKEFAKISGPWARKLISVKVGIPIGNRDLINELAKQGKEKNAETVGDYLGRTLANLAPPEIRGVYA